MQFSSKEDIDAPIERVFVLLSDFELFERSAIRRGIDVRRLTEITQLAAGAAWQADFRMRGKPRRMRLELVVHEPPHAMVFAGDSQGIDTRLTLDLIALSPRRTRMAVVLNLTPKTLSARLMIQSLRLAKANLSKRFKLKAAEYARSLENRAQRSG
ncbi:SRPBCC family protein [Sedimentitalea sp. JM2-8]|uniref:SRPBCC family protein n=1 Tax=Sedimentitalea xiamensis TaxID=3050037 RepID=A0ABT7FFQ9_9RHOB|nr:SRPBCC family protein [Sedimentitalea xiamensis]MDK3073956.1 SRPBCC family protein [Sedimentitalea xiamensis]